MGAAGLNLTILQACGVWEDLVLAAEGLHGFGGDTAEIYAYRLQTHSPRAVAGSRDAEMEQAQQAGANLLALCRAFAERHERRIEIDGSDISAYGQFWGFGHRVHVRVMAP